MPDDVRAHMLIEDDILSPDGEIRVTEKKVRGKIVTLKLLIGTSGAKERFLTLPSDKKIPIYNYD